MKKELNRLVNEHILNFDIKELDYNDNKNDIHNLLLAIDIFCYEGRFDFPDFSRENWSLEHIFPQNPEDFGEELGSNDIALISELSDSNKWKDVPKIFDENGTEVNTQDICDILNQKLKNKKPCEISEYERKILNHVVKTDKLHTIGNMALLTREDNSSNSNGKFDAKRINIASRVKNGSFVPRHTYDVFSKLLSDKMNPDLKVWNEMDIDEHFKYLREKFVLLKGVGNE